MELRPLCAQCADESFNSSQPARDKRPMTGRVEARTPCASRDQNYLRRKHAPRLLAPVASRQIANRKARARRSHTRAPTGDLAIWRVGELATSRRCFEPRRCP